MVKTPQITLSGSSLMNLHVIYSAYLYFAPTLPLTNRGNRQPASWEPPSGQHFFPLPCMTLANRWCSLSSSHLRHTGFTTFLTTQTKERPHINLDQYSHTFMYSSTHTELHTWRFYLPSGEQDIIHTCNAPPLRTSDHNESSHISGNSPTPSVQANDLRKPWEKSFV